jgi:hypothetical protein
LEGHILYNLKCVVGVIVTDFLPYGGDLLNLLSHFILNKNSDFAELVQ